MLNEESLPPSFLQKWIEDHAGAGCAFCGHVNPGLPKPGLVQFQIVRNAGRADNYLALCRNCAASFDMVLKPAIFRALVEHNEGRVPESWKHGDGMLRKAAEDEK